MADNNRYLSISSLWKGHVGNFEYGGFSRGRQPKLDAQVWVTVDFQNIF